MGPESLKLGPEQLQKVEKAPPTPTEARDRILQVLRERVPRTNAELQKEVNTFVNAHELQNLPPDHREAFEQAVADAIREYVANLKDELPVDGITELDASAAIRSIIQG